jgi:hypothetical protein
MMMMVVAAAVVLVLVKMRIRMMMLMMMMMMVPPVFSKGAGAGKAVLAPRPAQVGQDYAAQGPLGWVLLPDAPMLRIWCIEH